MTNSLTPYANLEPSLILDAIESVGCRCDGSLYALNSYENRVYQVGIEDQPPLIAKFYRPHRWTDAAILEEHAFSFELAKQEIPVIPPLVREDRSLFYFQDFRFALFRRQGGRPLEVDNRDHLEWIGRFLGRMHAVGAQRMFSHRPSLNVSTYGEQPYQYLIDHAFIPIELRDNYDTVMRDLLTLIRVVYDEIGELQVIRLHGDCHAGNILWNGQGPLIVDLDDCLMGPAIQDIWMLLSGGHSSEVDQQLATILKGYREFYDFDMREARLIEALRTLRMIHYSGWLAKRWADPAFPLNFPWFNTHRYWQEQLQHLREQSELLSQMLSEGFGA